MCDGSSSLSELPRRRTASGRQCCQVASKRCLPFKSRLPPPATYYAHRGVESHRTVVVRGVADAVAGHCGVCGALGPWTASGIIKISALLAQTIRVCGRCVLKSHSSTCFHLSNWREQFRAAKISRIRFVSNVLTRFAEICASVGYADRNAARIDAFTWRTRLRGLELQDSVAVTHVVHN